MENQENQENQEKKHKRRVRYSGTHPRNYKEKYKELNPEKYADTISKVIKKGGTPDVAGGKKSWKKGVCVCRDI